MLRWLIKKLEIYFYGETYEQMSDKQLYTQEKLEEALQSNDELIEENKELRFKLYNGRL